MIHDILTIFIASCLFLWLFLGLPWFASSPPAEYKQDRFVLRDWDDHLVFDPTQPTDWEALEAQLERTVAKRFG